MCIDICLYLYIYMIDIYMHPYNFFLRSGCVTTLKRDLPRNFKNRVALTTLFLGV